MTDKSTASFTQAMLSLRMKFCLSSWTCLQEIVIKFFHIMDATALAHRKDLKFWSSNLQNATSEKVLQVPYTRHKDRVLIADPYTRLLLQRYAREQPPLTMLEFTKMVELLGFHTLPFQNLVKSFGNSTCPPPYVPFLKSLALDSPICGMFHPSKNLRQTLIEMREKDPRTSPKLLEDLQMQLPLVFKLIWLLRRPIWVFLLKNYNSKTLYFLTICYLNQL
ncbi:uncharacterized protein LOC128175361 [Crassostrea angulata]|uniref:uncharacterized protein LOC128175361 n=1 Tax=Magallana angulata TaxID=2784310 RepID=UPI0022B136FF|nr:uncharacterized protein LOC128175361 [Crassostrea angulata]